MFSQLSTHLETQQRLRSDIAFNCVVNAAIQPAPICTSITKG